MQTCNATKIAVRGRAGERAVTEGGGGEDGASVSFFLLFNSSVFFTLQPIRYPSNAF